MTFGSRLIELSRASEWWDYKIAPGLAVLYASALIGSVAPSIVLTAMLQYLIALGAGATFVGAVNDLTDRADDWRAGKYNPAATGARASWALVAVAVAVGIAMLWVFRAQPLAFWTYVLGWLAFAAYSLPPLRLKGRPILGVVCDATGAHVVPAVLAAALVLPAMRTSDPWLPSIIAWSLAYGLRGILAHQLGDEASDRRSGTETFVVRYGAHSTQRLVRLTIFPVELLVLAAMLALMGSVVAVAALILALAFLYAKTFTFGSKAVLASMGKNEIMVLADFYILFWPLALVIELIAKDYLFGILLPLHCLLFFAYMSQTGRDLAALARQ